MNQSLTRLQSVVNLLDPDLQHAFFVGSADDSLVVAFTPNHDSTVDPVALDRLPPLGAEIEVWLHAPTLPREVSGRLAAFVRAHDTARVALESTRRWLALTGSVSVEKTSIPAPLVSRHEDWIVVRIVTGELPTRLASASPR
jgi:hypothetical protein